MHPYLILRDDGHPLNKAKEKLRRELGNHVRFPQNGDELLRSCLSCLLVGYGGFNGIELLLRLVVFILILSRLRVSSDKRFRLIGNLIDSGFKTGIVLKKRRCVKDV